MYEREECDSWRKQGRIVHRSGIENIKKKVDIQKEYIMRKRINVKDFIFYEYICKMYILTDLKWNCKKSRFI